jgi:uncharacterized protein YjeT (DUF2065 family)
VSTIGFMWIDLARALALVMVLEGLVPFASPKRIRAVFTRISTLDDRALRMLGLVSMMLGLIGLQAIRWLGSR